MDSAKRRLQAVLCADGVGYSRLMGADDTHTLNTLSARKTPYRDGSTDVVFAPLDFMARLAALVPTPRVNLTRYHGAMFIDWRAEPSTACAIDGRFIFGIGAGWNVSEMGHHGVAFETRWREMRERLAAVRALWSRERASFAGEFVQFAESWQCPKLLRPEGPPVVLGTLNTPFGRAQVARHGDGWLPLAFDVDETAANIADVHKQMRALGRDPDQLEVSLFFLNDEIQSAQTIAKARGTGVKRAIMRLPIGNENVVLKALDEYARHID